MKKGHLIVLESEIDIYKQLNKNNINEEMKTENFNKFNDEITSSNNSKIIKRIDSKRLSSVNKENIADLIEKESLKTDNDMKILDTKPSDSPGKEFLKTMLMV